MWLSGIADHGAGDLVSPCKVAISAHCHKLVHLLIIVMRPYMLLGRKTTSNHWVDVISQYLSPRLPMHIIYSPFMEYAHYWMCQVVKVAWFDGFRILPRFWDRYSRLTVRTYYSLLLSDFNEKLLVFEQFELKGHNILLASLPMVL